ncbi:MAG: archaeal proteasome endopeptidase complex subunit beta [Candidatus Bathyarchaeia archaeon]
MSDQAQGRYYMPGATTIGLVFADGVILASEKRVTYGSMIMSKTGKKVFKVSDQIGVACAGLVSDMQILAKEIEAQAKLFTFDAKRPMSVKAASKVLANILFNRRMYPLLTQTIVGGFDEDGPAIYVLDVLGSLLPDDYAAVGSGAQMSTGVLEQGYDPKMSKDQAKALVLKSLKSAVRRDVMSGDGIDLLIITKDGIEEESISF